MTSDVLRLKTTEEEVVKNKYKFGGQYCNGSLS